MTKITICSLILLIISGCNLYRVVRLPGAGYHIEIVNPKFGLEPYTLSSDLIDSNAIYVEDQRSYPTEVYTALRFHNNGWVDQVTVFEKFELQPSDFKIFEKSSNRGRYTLEGSKLKVEFFYPNLPPAKCYSRVRYKGEVGGNTLILISGVPVLYRQSTKYRFVENELVKME